ncbi:MULTISPECIES: ABC-three component system protein [Methanobacterium]|uniref:ABC-three component systems C-terminal domain-containing protein n=1 Tax=Methanobacterium bryantii TaxID=2161 RepID=A0A2A2H2Z5_METBR|nr:MULTISPECIES: ABC-three component system protein [Methanobacterium]OEC87660.1 hypothetical protein A9507_00160 [Methanobacterium sp. A39]PAV03704.1 hypothetical protein ASJ80_01690 [Methanobacterium bryantii]
MGNKTSKFSANASYLGYMYQVRYALYNSLVKIKDRLYDEFSISIETLDDVVFHQEFKPMEILQTKHHLREETRLTDRSKELWKSIRIWGEGIKNNTIPINSNFFLITTAEVPNNTIIKYLKSDDDLRDIKEVLKAFNEISSEKTNETNLPGYKAFRSLSESEKEKLLSNIFVIDSAPSILDLDKLLIQEIIPAANKKDWDSFLKRLEGWWIRRVCEHVLPEKKINISSSEILGQMSSLRDQFKEDSLPIDDDEIEERLSWLVDDSSHDDRIFVKQLKMINVSNKRVFRAIKNYYRAYEQRSIWLEDGFLFPGELEKYEEKLMEEWEYIFEQQKDEMGEIASEREKKKAARAIYSWVETKASCYIRPECTEPYVIRGTYQKLADDLHVGWHPEFKERLMYLLEK